MWVAVQVAVAVGSSLPALPCTAVPPSPFPLPLNPHSSLHSPVCCWLWPCHALCIASFAAFCGRQAAALHCLPPAPLFAQSCPLVRPYAKQLQRQQLLRSWLLHCKCECDSESETATSMTTTKRTTTTVSDAECNLSKKSRENGGNMLGQRQRQSRAAETTLCFGINMSAFKLICVAYG